MRAEDLHGCLGDNVKVHFAGAENFEFAWIAHDAGVRYFLFTVLPFIMDQFDIKWGRITCAKHKLPYKELPSIANYVIMDSGLFSIMFGACKDVKPDEKFIRRYKDAIVNFVLENNLQNLTCVECDCQKLLGVDVAWDLRKQMREQLPDTRIINVFHYEDGRKGLDSLIDFAEYIAISVPELRIVKPKTYKEDTYRLASYIKERKPEIDIHLLGGTEYEMLRRCKFCTSADSTSWLSVNRFGRILGYKTSQIKATKVDDLKDRIARLLTEIGVEVTDKRIEYLSNIWLSGHLSKQKYEKYAGNQD